MTLSPFHSPDPHRATGGFSRPGLALAAIIHLALGYALVTGLDIRAVFDPPKSPLVLADVTAPKPLEPVKLPVTDFVKAETKAPILDDPLPPVPLPPIPGPVHIDLSPAQPTGPTASAGDGIEIIPPSPPRLPVAETFTPARGRPGNVITEDDYPAASRRIGEEGVVEARYTVDLSGRARGCSVTVSSGFPRLDAATCERIERRFRFAPARRGDAAVEEERTQKVRWALQG